jgi:hypothetical protein
MVALANLVIADRESSPANHTFVPMSRDGADSVKLREAGITPAGDAIITLTCRRLSDGGYRCSLKIEVPILATQVLGGVTTYIAQRKSLASLELRFAADSTLQERKNLVGYVSNALLAANTVVVDPLTKLEGWT